MALASNDGCKSGSLRPGLRDQMDGLCFSFFILREWFTATLLPETKLWMENTSGGAEEVLKVFE
jgi:hypothetical protein